RRERGRGGAVVQRVANVHAQIVRRRVRRLGKARHAGEGRPCAARAGRRGGPLRLNRDFVHTTVVAGGRSRQRDRVRGGRTAGEGVVRTEPAILRVLQIGVK